MNHSYPRNQRIYQLFEAQQGKGHGNFLFLDSASYQLLQQSGENLAKRTYHELTPFRTEETPVVDKDVLRTRGGFLGSFLAQSNTIANSWRIKIH